MDSNPSAPRFTVVILRLKNEEARVRTAQALSRMAGLPSERVLARLDSLPWALLKLAPREKAQKLVAALRDCGAETTTIPPMEEEAGVESVEPQSAIAQAPGASLGGSPERAETPHIPTAPQAAGPLVEDAADFEPLPLEGVLSPGFRIESSDNRLLWFFSAVWQVFSGSLRAVTGALDRSLVILRDHFWKLLAIAGLPWLLGGGLIGIGFAVIKAFGLNWDTLTRAPVWAIVLAVVALVPLVFVAAVMLFTLPTVALIHSVSNIYLVREVSLSGAYRFALNRLVRYVLTTMLMGGVLTGAFVAGGFVYGVALLPTWLILTVDGPGGWALVAAAIALLPLFVGPVSYVGLKLMFYSEAVIIEDIAYGDALRRSWRLVSGRSGKSWYGSYFFVASVLISVYVPLSLIISLLFQGPPSLLEQLGLLPPPWGKILVQTCKYVGQFAAQTLATTVGVVFYYLVRSGKEGHDLLFLARAGGAQYRDNTANAASEGPGAP